LINKRIAIIFFLKKKDLLSLIKSGCGLYQECADNCTETANKRKYTEHIGKVRGSNQGVCQQDNTEEQEVHVLLLEKHDSLYHKLVHILAV
jgi:hypothetical protein